MTTATLHKAENIVSWDSKSLRQIDEAKAKYVQAKNENRRVTDLDGNVLSRFNPNLGDIKICEADMPDGHFAMRILDETGDRRLVWNSRDPDQIKEASELFEKHIKAGGRAYAIKRDGSKGFRIHGFNARDEEIVIDEKGTREKLRDFAKLFKEVKMLPKTYPG